MNDTNRQLEWKRITYYSNERHHVNEVNNAILYIYYYFPFFFHSILERSKIYPPTFNRIPTGAPAGAGSY